MTIKVNFLISSLESSMKRDIIFLPKSSEFFNLYKIVLLTFFYRMYREIEYMVLSVTCRNVTFEVTMMLQSKEIPWYFDAMKFTY